MSNKQHKAAQVQALCDYIKGDDALQKLLPDAEEAMVYHCGNMGAILVDVILQRGARYKFVSRKAGEVKALGYTTIAKIRDDKEWFMDFFKKTGWLRKEYPKTFTGLLEKIPLEVDTAEDVYKWLSDADERKKLTEIHGVLEKTADKLKGVTRRQLDGAIWDLGEQASK